MSDSNGNDTWQVEVSGQVYEAKFAELTDWIAEGALQPDDKVRRGNLRWIEAKKVPVLIDFFNAKLNGLPPPAVIVSTTHGEQPEKLPGDSENEAATTSTVNVSSSSPEQQSALDSLLSFESIDSESAQIGTDHCLTHPDRPTVFVCLTCSRAACKECVKRFGSSVAVCSSCGGMCNPKAELDDTHQKAEFRDQSIQAGFGFGDFAHAITYPFKFKTSLIFGALMFMLFSLGRTATFFGGIYMIVASIFSYMLSNMLAFGILTNTVNSFAHGKIGGNFMPDFEDFSLWDDVIHPFFLSIGVYVSAFGPFIVVLLIGSYLVMSTISSEADAMKANLENTPGTPYYSARDTLDQSNQVKGVLANTERLNQENLDAQEKLEHGQAPAAVVGQEEENIQRVNNMIADSKRKELESVVGKSPETRNRESAAFATRLLNLAAPLVVIGFITLLWGLFFFPAACTVAGYSQSFVETINPLIGLDTIKRFGFDYVKILFMAILMFIVFAVFSFALSLVFMSFDMPGVGNLPARAVESLIWFYMVIVFSCLLGSALFKASDRFRLVS